MKATTTHIYRRRWNKLRSKGLLQNTSTKQQQQQRRHQSTKSAFDSQLEESGFRIFQKTADYGFYAWKPRGLPKSVDRILSSYEITDCLDSGKDGSINNILPKLFVGLECIPLPFQFQKLPFYRIDNSFPYGHFEMASLTVAAQRKVFAENSIDFIFSSRALEWLARKRMSQGKIVVAKIPVMGSNSTTGNAIQNQPILITRYEDYATDYASIGHQFKRIMTGQSELFGEGNAALEFIEHLQVLKVGDFKVLCISEPDAIEKTGDHVDPIKVKVSKVGRYNPDIFDTNVLFNLITGGFPRLYHGVRRDYTTLLRIDKIALEQFATSAFTNVMSRVSLEDNILSGLEALLKQMKNANSLEVFEASYDKGPLSLTPSSIPVLPSASIVKELLAG